MNPGRSKPTTFFILSILAALLAWGCGSELHRSFAPNQPPRVRLDRPVATAGDEQALGYAMSWKAEDGDGHVSHYLYALDPGSVERADERWARTGETSVTIRFPRPSGLGRTAPVAARPRDEFHVFAVRAVDDRGAESPSATLAFFDDNIAPIVLIESPMPNSVFTPITTTSPTITWRGTDLDGHITRYKYRLFTRVNPDFPAIPDFIALVLQDPDTLRALYGPTFASWDSVGPGITSVHYQDLAPNQFHLFALTAMDNRGAYDVVFSLSTNVLKFAVTYPGTLGPSICASSPLFNFCQFLPTSEAPMLEFPAGVSVPVSWFAVPLAGASITGYRWTLDPKDPLDDRRRTWTAWSLDNTSVTLGPYSGEEEVQEHLLIIQARDNNGLIGTLRLQFVVVRPEVSGDLLVVDDTRLALDQRCCGDGELQPPRGPWPTAAELDTFLYARGGFPWQGYPAGTLSPPGILAGYDFDTLGTRGLPDGVVPLSVLARYRHVIWLTDAVGATYLGSPSDVLAPITSLRLMSAPGQQSTLAAYAAQGGKLWVQGGGAAYATLAAWNRRNTAPDEFTNSDLELVAGRLMYDFAGWRSGIKIAQPAQQALLNVPQVLGDPTAAPGRGWTGQPPYQKLGTRATILSGRTCASDPPSPLRLCNSFYLVQFYPAEFLFRSNTLVEDVDPRPNHEALVSVLDTLYVTAGGTAAPGSPVMTYYHGSQGPPMVFSGFPIWHFQRQQCTALTDFVLQDIWGLNRQPLVGQPVAGIARRER